MASRIRAKRAILPRPALAAFAGLWLLASCAPFPDFEAMAPLNDAPPPALMPVEALLAAVPPARSGAQTADALQARASRLKARGAAMQGPINDPQTRARLLQLGS